MITVLWDLLSPPKESINASNRKTGQFSVTIVSVVLSVLIWRRMRSTLIQCTSIQGKSAGQCEPTDIIFPGQDISLGNSRSNSDSRSVVNDVGFSLLFP